MEFNLERTGGKARCGTVTTDHGSFPTPAFMPVGTQGTVKAMSPRDLDDIQARIILSNTYHLYLRPGMEVLESAGGLHRFMCWDKPILTDSGGYQVFSLSDLRTIEENGVIFRSHLDGSKHLFTPEKVVDIQRSIGSDIMMVLDECTPYPAEREYALASADRTFRWAARCQQRYHQTSGNYGHSQSLFCIVQGSIYEDLRRISAESLISCGFEGYAIGGLAVGEPAALMYDIVDICTEVLPQEKPRYLMGVGTPADLLEAIDRGVDMFDCVLPTRNGRNAMLFTQSGSMTISNAQYKNDSAPVDASCGCYCCQNFSRAYLRHLFQAKEILALRLATIHNLYFYQWLLREARCAVLKGNFTLWKQTQLFMLQKEAIVYS